MYTDKILSLQRLPARATSFQYTVLRESYGICRDGDYSPPAPMHSCHVDT